RGGRVNDPLHPRLERKSEAFSAATREVARVLCRAVSGLPPNGQAVTMPHRAPVSGHWSISYVHADIFYLNTESSACAVIQRSQLFRKQRAFRLYSDPHGNVAGLRC